MVLLARVWYHTSPISLVSSLSGSIFHPSILLDRLALFVHMPSNMYLDTFSHFPRNFWCVWDTNEAVRIRALYAKSYGTVYRKGSEGSRNWSTSIQNKEEPGSVGKKENCASAVAFADTKEGEEAQKRTIQIIKSGRVTQPQESIISDQCLQQQFLETGRESDSLWKFINEWNFWKQVPPNCGKLLYCLLWRKRLVCVLSWKTILKSKVENFIYLGPLFVPKNLPTHRR